MDNSLIGVKLIAGVFQKCTYVSLAAVNMEAPLTKEAWRRGPEISNYA